uniref:CARD domain-containing protein n=1 Tax=Seriola dumerili TaxID=41447 RepID=A0A3B4USM8_SERDU
MLQSPFILLHASNWVDNNIAHLIQNVTSVMQIADIMRQQRVILEEMYANIRAATTSMEQMRVLYGALKTTKAKSVFFRILHEIQPHYISKDIIMLA